jgi:NAD(P) transhydrogenase
VTSTRESLFDLIVIGSGPAGQRAAIQGAKAGKKVALVEAHPAWGGACVHVGTLPSKSLRESVYRYSLSARGTLGREAEHHVGVSRKKVLPEMSRLMRRAQRVIRDEGAVISNQLTRNGVQMIHGRARLLSANDVEVQRPKSREVLTADFIIIATGARPVAPVHLGVDGKKVLDSNSILSLKKLPKSLVVLGAGIIGCEYASMLSIAGTKVTLVDRRQEILASVDREIVNHLVERMATDGVEILLGCEATRIDRPPKGGLRIHLSNGRKISSEIALVAQGRFGNTDGMGLHEVGVRTDERGLIQVDQHFRTDIPNIYAVGDVVGPPALASTSFEQGRIACCHAFQLPDGAGYVDYTMPIFFPYGIYTIPEISMLGQTEEELIALKADFVVGRSKYRELARGQIVGDRWGILKLLVDRKTRKLLGVHIVGDNAAELIHIGQAVMSFGGDVNYFVHTVFNYPTLAEAYKTAAFHALNQILGRATTY